MRLNRISGGQTESVNGCERLANNLIGSQIASATIQIGVPSNSKKNTAVAAVIWFLKSIYICCQSTPSTNIAMLIVNCQLFRRRYFLFYLSAYKRSPICIFCVWLRLQPIGRKGATDQKVNYCHQVDSYKQPNCHLSDIQSMCGDQTVRVLRTSRYPASSFFAPLRSWER